MPSKFTIDSKDLRFALFDLFKIQDLTKYQYYKHLDHQQLEDILSQAERLAVELVSPLNALSEPPKYQNGKIVMPKEFYPTFRKYADGGWISSNLEKRLGGWGLPETIRMVIREIFNGACGGFYVFSAVTTAAMNLIQSYGTESQKNKYIPQMAKGIYTGTMCLTEPDSGSYLADLKASAKRNGNGFKIKGSKIFIGIGDHDNMAENIIHLVLARIEGAPAGYAGQSLFIVPKYHVNEDGSIGSPNDVTCTGLEKKMGWDWAPTASLSFGDNDQCEGFLLGKEGQGLAQMFQMMNEMRLATAAQGVGLGAAAYQIALSFAKERIQGLSYKKRKEDPAVQVPIIDHPDIRRNLLFMKSIVEGCRRLILQTALYDDFAILVDDEQEKEYYKDLVEILTPVCKAYATDMGFKVAETAIQSMGGYGYMKDFGAERCLRDSKVACLYEGTNGIHAIDLQRRKIRIHGGRLFKNLLREIDSFIEPNKNNPVLGDAIKKLDAAKNVMIEVSKSFSVKNEEDSGLPLSVAKPYLDMTGHIICTWMLLKSAAVAEALRKNPNISSEDRLFYDGKIYTAQFAVANLLPQVEGLRQTINAWDRSILDIAIASF